MRTRTMVIQLRDYFDHRLRRGMFLVISCDLLFVEDTAAQLSRVCSCGPLRFLSNFSLSALISSILRFTYTYVCTKPFPVFWNKKILLRISKISTFPICFFLPPLLVSFLFRRSTLEKQQQGSRWRSACRTELLTGPKEISKVPQQDSPKKIIEKEKRLEARMSKLKKQCSGVAEIVTPRKETRELLREISYLVFFVHFLS